MSGLGALAAIALVASAAGAEPAAKPKSKGPAYTIVFEVKKGNYGSRRTIPGDLTEGEIDNFSAQANYPGVVLPAKGTVSIKRASSHESFEGDGAGPEWEEYGSGEASFHCTGKLESDPTIPPLIRGSSSGKTLSLKVELAKNVQVTDAQGTVSSASCSQLYDGGSALYPASSRGDVMPGMLTAQLSVPLTLLRGLKVGKTKSVAVNGSDNALKHPPANCALSAEEECTQQLGWKGSIEFTRTG